MDWKPSKPSDPTKIPDWVWSQLSKPQAEWMNGLWEDNRSRHGSQSSDNQGDNLLHQPPRTTLTANMHGAGRPFVPNLFGRPYPQGAGREHWKSVFDASPRFCVAGQSTVRITVRNVFELVRNCGVKCSEHGRSKRSIDGLLPLIWAMFAFPSVHELLNLVESYINQHSQAPYRPHSVQHIFKHQFGLPESFSSVASALTDIHSSLNHYLSPGTLSPLDQIVLYKKLGQNIALIRKKLDIDELDRDDLDAAVDMLHTFRPALQRVLWPGERIENHSSPDSLLYTLLATQYDQSRCHTSYASYNDAEEALRPVIDRAEKLALIVEHLGIPAILALAADPSWPKILDQTLKQPMLWMLPCLKIAHFDIIHEGLDRLADYVDKNKSLAWSQFRVLKYLKLKDTCSACCGFQIHEPERLLSNGQ